MHVKIYGASDDNIEVDIDGQPFEEHNHYDSSYDSPCIVAFSSGTVARVWYDEGGIWRVLIMYMGNAVNHILTTCSGSDNDYSDIVEFDISELTWVIFAKEGMIAARGDDGRSRSSHF